MPPDSDRHEAGSSLGQPRAASGSLGQPRAASAHVRLSYFETNLDKEVSVQAAAASYAAFPLSSCDGPNYFESEQSPGPSD